MMIMFFSMIWEWSLCFNGRKSDLLYRSLISDLKIMGKINLHHVYFTKYISQTFRPRCINKLFFKLITSAVFTGRLYIFTIHKSEENNRQALSLEKDNLQAQKKQHLVIWGSTSAIAHPPCSPILRWQWGNLKRRRTAWLQGNIWAVPPSFTTECVHAG